MPPSRMCSECGRVFDSRGCCSRNCPNTADLDDDCCDYCGEPLDDGLCSASCKESAADEGREADEEDEDEDFEEIKELEL